ncbi:MAG: helix-turn-helix domain-containing protein [Phycisphaeraceae bacterium]
MPHSSLVQSVLRGMDIVDLVSQSEIGLSLRDVCTALRLKQPTAHNLIRTLVARGFVEKTTSPVRYRLGPAVTRLAGERASHSITRAAANVMGRFFHQIRAELPAHIGPYEEAAVTFGRWIGDEVMMVLRLRLHQPGVLERPMKAFNPYQSAAALVFQAHWTQEERKAFWRRHPMAEFGGQVWKSEEQLLEFLGQVRQAGYAQPPFYKDGQFRVAVPVFAAGGREAGAGTSKGGASGGGELVGALGLGVWLELDKGQGRRFVGELIEAARQISDAAVPPSVEVADE